MLNNARRIMNERAELANKANAVINEAQAALKELGFVEVQDLEEVIPTITINNEDKMAPVITISKGKIIEVPVTKEIIIDNTEELEQLKNELKVYKGMAAGYEAQLQNKNLTIESLEKQIANMKEDKLRAEIKANKNNNSTKLQAELNQLKEDILDLKDELEIKCCIIQNLNEQLAVQETINKKLESDIQKQKAEVYTEVFSEPTEEKQQPKKGDDNSVKSKLDLLKKIKKAPEFTLEQAIKEQKDKIAKEQEDKEARKAQLPEHSLNYEEITFNKSLNTNTMFGIHGTITIEGKAYAFKATNNHHMPIVYGCFDMNTIKLAKEIITNDVERFSFSNDEDIINYSHMNDSYGRLVIWRLTDAKGNVSYHGYSDNYIVAWNAKKYDVPSRKMMKYALDENPKHFRKIEQQKNAKKLSDKFIAVCKELYAADFTPDNDPEPTKAVTKITKEQQQNTNDEISNMIHERHQHAKENRIESIQSAIRYNGPVVEFTKVTNDVTEDNSVFDDADDIDL